MEKISESSAKMDKKKDKDEDTGKKLFMVSKTTGECSSFPIISGDDKLDRFAETETLRRINPQAEVRKGDEVIEVLVKIPSIRLQYLLGGMDEDDDMAKNVQTIPAPPNHPVSRVNGAPLMILQVGEEDKPSNEQTIRSTPSTSSSAPISNLPTFNTAPLLLLRIGAWLAVPTNDGDLVAKFDYRSKKLAWEILKEDGASKHKIEIDWSNIIGIQATIEDNRQGIFQLELQKPPRFYKLEVEANPRKQPRWTNESDFTQGRASLNRRHFVVLPPGVIDAHYKRLMKNKHLLEVSQKPFPTKSSHFPQAREE